MKTILITGASTGLGKATAKLFQAKGWKVIATMRSPEKETELNQLNNVTLLRYYEEADHGISWQTDQVRNWRRSATNAVEALLQS